MAVRANSKVSSNASVEGVARWGAGELAGSAVARIGVPLHESPTLESGDDLGDVGGVATELVGELAHPRGLETPAQDAGLGDGHPVSLGCGLGSRS